MQGIESRGQLKVAAAQRRQESSYWRAKFENGWEKSCFSHDPHADMSAGRETVAVSLASSLVEQLRRLSGAKELALQAIIASAAVALLRRHTRKDEVVIGQPCLSMGTERTPLAPALPLRISVHSGCTFKDLLARVREEMLEAVAHQDYPIELLAEEFGLPEGPDINPFFDVAVEVGNTATLAGKIAMPYCMLIKLAVDGSSLAISAAYNARKFRRTSVERILRHVVTVLEEGVRNPESRPGDVDLLSEAERRLLRATNTTETSYDQLCRIEQVFARQARLTPNAVAVAGEKYTVSYAELDQRANRLANTLRANGVAADQIVAVLAERSLEMMVAILGILKAGAAYLPLDPTYPSARIDYILQDSGAQLVLASASGLAKVKREQPTINLAQTESYSENGEPPQKIGTSSNLAYAIYTSGSTGLPKGVLIEHRSVINRIQWMQRAYPIGPTDIILQKTPISFDVSVWELFWWAFAGAHVCLLPPGCEREPEAIVEAICRYNVTTLHFVPSMLNAFLDYVAAAGSASKLKHLRWVFASGEALETHQVHRFHQILDCELVNLYGPTEATVDVSHYHCRRGDNLGCVPIGRPIDNIRLYVVDDRMRPLPIGIPGELCIAGVGLARGYHNRQELTSERFINGASCGETRLYRTGDLARWSEQGEIEYLGRLDDQVKVRGYRIETGEIELRLRQYPGVKDAIVIARKMEDGQNQLWAYVVCGGSAGENGFKAYLAQSLPEYMVPAHIVALDSFPLTPNGKLDRRALPDPRSLKASAQSYVAPGTEIEKMLAGIWEEVLDRKPIGIHDNFFNLGGNSIHFVTVLARARARGLIFSFQQLFANPTIAGLVPVLTGSRDSDGPLQRLGPFELLRPEDRSRMPSAAEDGYPLSMLQAGLIFQNELTFGTAQYHDIISYIIQSPFDAPAFTQAVKTLVQRHPILRTSYHLSGFEEHIQIVHREVPLPLCIVDQRGMTEAEQETWFTTWLNAEKARRFEWEKGGLVCFHVHVLRDDLYRYTLSQHNSALDGWSITLIHTQMFDLYYKVREGRDAVLPPVDNHLRNYIALEREARRRAEDRQYWTSQMERMRFTTLPRWRPERESQPFAVIFHDVEIPASLSERIVALADSLAIPVKTLLMTAHLKVLSALAGDRDVVTGYEHSGRPEVEDATEAVGLFLNTVPFRVNISDGNWQQLIRTVYDSEIEMLPHRRYPMAQVKQDLGIQKQLFETAFNYTHFYLLKKLRSLPEFSLLDVRANSETEFVLRAEFSRHFFTDQVRLCLHYHEHVFSAEQVAMFGGYYRRALELMTENVLAEHHLQSLLGPDEGCLPPLQLRPNDIPRWFATGQLHAERNVRVHVLDHAMLVAPLGAPGQVWIEDEGGEPGEDVEIRGLRLRKTRLSARRLPDGEIEWLFQSEAASFSHAEANADEDEGRVPTPVTTESEKKIAAVWAKVLGLPVEEISVQDNFFDLGGNSLAVMRAVLLLEKRISLADFMRNSTLGPLAKVLDSKNAGQETTLLQRFSFSAVTEEYALVCFPYAGGNAINFRALAQALSAAGAPIMVYGVELPGHDAARPNEKLLGVREVARLVAGDIQKQIRTRVILWGHCVGSAFAIETAHLLEERGVTVERIFVGGKLFATLEEIELSIDEVSTLTNQDAVEALITELGFSELRGISPDNARIIATSFRNDSLSANRYLAELRRGPRKQLTTPITLVVATDDRLTTDYEQRAQDWQLVANSVQLKEIDGGGHYFCSTRPAEVAALVLSECSGETTIQARLAGYENSTGSSHGKGKAAGQYC